MEDTSIIKREAEDLLYLMSCAVNDASPNAERVSPMDLASLLELATFHSVAAMVGMALKKAVPLSPEWDKVIATSEYRYALAKVERGKVIASLAQAGIRCVCLKGVVLAERYPSPVMREMCDNDLLYEYSPENALTVRSIMEGMGYATKAFDGTNTDEYVKRPIFNFEMHAALESGETAFHRQGDRVFDEVWEHAVPFLEEPGAFALDPTDFYLYFIAHAFKHYQTGTMGVRVLADAYVVRRAYASSLDGGRLKDGLSALGATEFDAQVNGLALDLMEDPSRITERLRHLDSARRTMLANMLDSGTYGTSSTVIQHKLQAVAKDGMSSNALRRRYLARRLFPSVDVMGMLFPMCRRHPALLPVFYVYRIVRGVGTKRDAIGAELNVLDSELASTREQSQDQHL